jgi:cytochrome P450
MSFLSTHTDPIAKIELRAATPEESAQQRGGYAWGIARLPWDITRKVMGTAKLIFVGANGVLWGRPTVQTLVDKACYWLGFRPEETFMETFHTFPLGNLHQIYGSTKAMKALLAHHRNKDIFANSMSMSKLFQFCQRVFPEEQITEDDFMLTCSPEKTKEYRSLLHTLLKGTNINAFADEIAKTSESTLHEWSEKESVNATIETRVHTTKIITKLMFGEDSSGSEIAQAIDFINLFIMKTVLKQVKPEDEAKFQEAIGVFRNKVEEVLKKDSAPIFAQDNALSQAQKKVLIFTIFFAGQETTASLMAWILHKLSTTPQLQQELQDQLKEHEPNSREQIELIEQFFSIEIGHFTPAFGTGRKLAQDVCIEYQLEGESQQRKLVIPKGEIIAARMWKHAEQKLATNETNYHEWLPFGYGPHSCPGETLAKKIVVLLLLDLLSNYTVTTSTTPDVKKIGLFTLKLSEDIIVNVQKKH